VVGLLLIAAYLRLYHLDFQSLWNDELSTMKRILNGPTTDQFWKSVHKDVQPPGYLTFLWGWTSLLGNSEYSLRLPSALAGILTVLAVYRLGRDLFDHSSGLCGAALAAVAPFLIEYSQEVRSFSIAAWLSAECACWLVRLSTAPGGRKLPWLPIGLCALSTAAAAYTHYMALLAVASLHFLFLIWAGIQARGKFPAVLAAQFMALVLYAPWIPGFLDHLEKGGLKWLREPTFADLLTIDQIVLPGLVLLFVGLLTAFRNTSHKEDPRNPNALQTGLAAPLLLGWITLIVAGSYIKSLHGSAIFNDRNMIVVLPAVFVCLGAGIGRHATWRQYLGCGAVCLFTLYAFVGEGAYYTEVKKQQFREAAALADTYAKEKPKTQVVTFAWSRTYFDYYFEQMGSDVRASGSSGNAKKLKKVVDGLFKKGATRVIVLAGHKRIRSAEKRAISSYERVRSKKFVGAEVILLERKKERRR
jgi:uncharacterized membrane protein